MNIMACLLKARTTEPEKQPLLENGSETAFVSRQMPRNNGTTPVARQQIVNNAIVGLQQWKSYVFYVVRAEELEARRGLVGHPVPVGYIYGDLALQIWGVSNLGQ
jgi:hypothetical protein